LESACTVTGYGGTASRAATRTASCRRSSRISSCAPSSVARSDRRSDNAIKDESFLPAVNSCLTTCLSTSITEIVPERLFAVSSDRPSSAVTRATGPRNRDARGSAAVSSAANAVTANAAARHDSAAIRDPRWIRECRMGHRSIRRLPALSIDCRADAASSRVGSFGASADASAPGACAPRARLGTKRPGRTPQGTLSLQRS